MLALGIDTATPMVSVALVHKERIAGSGPTLTGVPQLLARRDEHAPNAHGEVLSMLVAEVLAEAGRTANEIAAVGVGLGPGPFTGLRVGIVTAAAIADAVGCPAYGICSLDVVGASHASDEEPFVVVSDARRRQIYWAVYNETGGREEGPDIGAPADVAAQLRGRIGEVAGPSADTHAESFSGFRIAAPEWPDARRIAMHAWARRQLGAPADVLEPMYLRRPDARPPGPPKKVSAR